MAVRKFEKRAKNCRVKERSIYNYHENISITMIVIPKYTGPKYCLKTVNKLLKSIYY